MNGELFNKSYEDVTNEELRSINKITMPNGQVIDSMGVYASTCPCCNKRSRCIVDKKGYDLVFLCENRGTIVVGRMERKAVFLHA